MVVVHVCVCRNIHHMRYPWAFLRLVVVHVCVCVNIYLGLVHVDALVLKNRPFDGIKLLSVFVVLSITYL